MKRIARVDEVVRAIVFLCSRKAARITGEIVVVDGGMSGTSSLYTEWRESEAMNARFAPDGVKPLTKLSIWVDKKLERFRTPVANESWVKNTIGESNWYTNLADAHFKITDNYNKLDGEDHVLGALGQLKDVNGQIFTAENPKSARYIDDPDGKKRKPSKYLTPSLSTDFSRIDQPRSLSTKNMKQF